MTTLSEPPPQPTTKDGQDANQVRDDIAQIFRESMRYIQKKLTNRILRATGEVSDWDEHERPTLTSIPDIDGMSHAGSH